jgi:hypothetical protein
LLGQMTRPDRMEIRRGWKHTEVFKTDALLSDPDEGE